MLTSANADLSAFKSNFLKIISLSLQPFPGLKKQAMSETFQEHKNFGKLGNFDLSEFPIGL